MTELDVIILGAGPAGAAAGLILAPRHEVLLIERRAEPAPRIGESLIPAARRLLRDMRVLESFEAEGHSAYLGNRSYWGGPEPTEVDFLRGPDGPGWHLHRPRFERFLRTAAQRRGARLLAPAKLREVTRLGAGWRLTVDATEGVLSFTARLLIDAAGRGATLARRLGAKYRNTDRLIAAWLRGTVQQEDGTTAGFTVVESEPNGWWYTAPVPDESERRTRVLAFHTDADIAAASVGDATVLLDRARQLPGIGDTIYRTGFEADGPAKIATASSAVLNGFAGDRWIAIGDAALSLDPLAARGLFNALYTAMTGARACHELLEGMAADFSSYAADLARVSFAYDHDLALTYAAESRWPDRGFWARRRRRARAAGRSD